MGLGVVIFQPKNIILLYCDYYSVNYYYAFIYIGRDIPEIQGLKSGYCFRSGSNCSRYQATLLRNPPPSAPSITL
jgi:hypothetical protein